jgi:hypothetical protein
MNELLSSVSKRGVNLRLGGPGRAWRSQVRNGGVKPTTFCSLTGGVLELNGIYLPILSSARVDAAANVRAQGKSRLPADVANAAAATRSRGVDGAIFILSMVGHGTLVGMSFSILHNDYTVHWQKVSQRQLPVRS